MLGSKSYRYNPVDKTLSLVSDYEASLPAPLSFEAEGVSVLPKDMQDKTIEATPSLFSPEGKKNDSYETVIGQWAQWVSADLLKEVNPRNYDGIANKMGEFFMNGMDRTQALTFAIRQQKSSLFYDHIITLRQLWHVWGESLIPPLPPCQIQEAILSYEQPPEPVRALMMALFQTFNHYWEEMTPETSFSYMTWVSHGHRCAVCGDDVGQGTGFRVNNRRNQSLFYHKSCKPFFDDFKKICTEFLNDMCHQRQNAIQEVLAYRLHTRSVLGLPENATEEDVRKAIIAEMGDIAFLS